MGGFTQSLSCLQQEVPTIILSVILHEWKGLLSSVGIVMIRLLKLAVLKLEGELGKFTLEGRGSGNSMFVQSLRGDPFRDFQMSILATLTHPSSKSDIIKVTFMHSHPLCCFLWKLSFRTININRPLHRSICLHPATTQKNIHVICHFSPSSGLGG
ncbi:hypothetical protein CsSME_00003647 [Camellia sinensis var. sinensis]